MKSERVKESGAPGQAVKTCPVKPWWLSRRVLLRRVGALLAGAPALGLAQPATESGIVRFGAQPLSNVFEARNDWEPLLAELGRVIGKPVRPLLMNSYEALEQAIARNEVDIAFLSGKMALTAVTQHRMTTVAQVTRNNGAPGYRAILLTRRTGTSPSLQEILGKPEKWRIAHGEHLSMSGFIIPQLELFLPRNIVMRTRFRDEIIGTHQTTALAVANDDADLALNNTADFFLFTQRFPVEAARLQVIWESEMIPNEKIVVRRDYDAAFQKTLQDFFAHYPHGMDGKRAGPAHELPQWPIDLDGFIAAGNSSLLRDAQLNYSFERQRAMTAKWVSEAARAKRLQHIEADYAQQVAVLKGEIRLRD
jgi:phosphonate transport system substrate-binding protein